MNTKIFETLIFGDPPRFLRGLNTSPKPFVLYCADEKREYQKDEVLQFEMNLVGTAIEYHPFIIFAVHKMAQQGLGSRRFKFHLQQAFQRNEEGEWKRLYDGNSRKLRTAAKPLNTSRNNHTDANGKMTIQFLTPTRLKIDNELSMEFNFRELLFRMLRRTLELAHFYVPGAQVNWEFHELLKAASNIEITQKNLHWKDLNRYSARQKAEMYMGGFWGEIEMQGDLVPFKSTLSASEVLHVGKGTTFGLGKINLTNHN